MVNLKNISKAEVRQYIIINFFLVFLIQSCTRIVPKSQLVFKNCEIYWNKRLFTGEYELNKGDKYILSKVYKGKIKNEKTFSNNILLMEKIYNGCYFGIQKIIIVKENRLVKDLFNQMKGLVSGNILQKIVSTQSLTKNNYLLVIFYIDPSCF